LPAILPENSATLAEAYRTVPCLDARAVEKLNIHPEFLDSLAEPRVGCIFADGTRMDITHATQVRYKSFNTPVATVDQHGRVRLVGPGMTTVMANFNGQMKGALVDVAKPNPKLAAPKSSGGALPGT
jgi:hypothetical protein